MLSYLCKSYSALTFISRLLVSTRSADWREILDRHNAKPILVTFCNPLSIKIAVSSADYMSNLLRFDYVYADGILLARYASRHLRTPIERKSFDGNSLGGDILELLVSLKTPVALVGGVDGVSARAASLLEGIGVNVAYHRSGFFLDHNDRQSCFTSLSSMGIKVVIVGMGSPHQERFLIQLADSGWKGVGFTCGGYLDQLSIGDVEYYPAFINKYNLRAFYRIINEPRRLIPRYTIDYFPFYFSAIFGFICVLL